MSTLKDKLKDKIDAAGAAAKRAADTASARTTDLAHSAGKKMEQGAKALRNV